MKFSRGWPNSRSCSTLPRTTDFSARVCALVFVALCSSAIMSGGHAKDISQKTLISTSTSRDDSQPHISVELISKANTFGSEGSLTVGVKFTPDEHWHIYWLNPGDTGLAPEITWKLPAGYTANAINWPYPKSFPIAHLTNYGYENTVLLTTTITADSDVDKSKPIQVEADLSWLVCEEACIPGESSLSLPIQGNNDDPRISGSSALKFKPAEQEAFFDLWRSKVPKISKSIGSKVDIDTTQKTLGLSLYAQALLFKEAESVEVFVKDLDVVRYGKPIKIDWGNNWLKWEQELSEYYSKPPELLDVVVVIDREKSYEFLLSI